MTNEPDGTTSANVDDLDLAAMGLEGGVTRTGWWRARFALGGLIVAIVGIRLIALDQPIVENYVGRQIPTAMVARGMERGSGFWKPQLQTAPFPNYFVVEPPIYQSALLRVRRVTGLPIDAAGRATSALATGLAALALFFLVRRMKDAETALWCVAVFGVLPVTLRYGRSVQPDMLALACVLMGLNFFDRWARGGPWFWAVAGWPLLAAGLASRLLLIFALLPFALVVAQAVHRRGAAKSSLFTLIFMFLIMSPLLPAALWYRHALALLGEGSRAGQGSLQHWTEAVSPLNWLHFQTWEWLVRFGLIRAFTPIGLLILGRCLYLGVLNRFWVAWIVGGCLTLLAVSGKLHHEYYWLMLAPAVAVACGTLIARFRESAAFEGRAPAEAIVLFGVLAGLSLVLAWSTWKTPEEWSTLPEAAVSVQRHVRPNDLLIAREALLFYADRRGMRLETEPDSIRRAMAEWGEDATSPAPTVADLISVYDHYGRTARFLADTGPPTAEFFGSPIAHFAQTRGNRLVASGPGYWLIERVSESP